MRAIALLLLLAACKDAAKPGDSSAPTASVAVTPPSASPSAAPFDAAAFTVAAVTTPCRLIVVTGEATIPDAGELRSLQAAPPDFITLPLGSSLTAKDTKTGREVTLKGEGRGRVCVEGREEEWLAKGEFASVPGAGESPGAEVWVMTVNAVVRYALGHVHVTINGKATRVRGDAEVFVPPSSTLHGIDAGVPAVDANGWAHVTAGELEIESSPKSQGPHRTGEILDACSKEAAAAQALAKQMLAGDAGNIGDLGSRHVVLRQRARALCGIARLSINLASPVSSADEAKVVAAEAMWRDVPATR